MSGDVTPERRTPEAPVDEALNTELLDLAAPAAPPETAAPEPPPWCAGNLTDELAGNVESSWLMNVMHHQTQRSEPQCWMFVGGRGAGKTRAGAEWVNCIVHGRPPYSFGQKFGSIALVGATLGDVREVMVEGRAGVLAAARHERPRYEVTRRRLVWDNGAIAQLLSAENVGALRGPQFDAAWCDELGKWPNAVEAFDTLQMGLRLGKVQRQFITTTPRGTELLRRLYADSEVVRTKGATRDNRHLGAGFVNRVHQLYRNTWVERQELDGEMITDRTDGLWSRQALDARHVAAPPHMRRIVIAVDPPASSSKGSDACGIVAAGLDAGNNVYVLADESRRRLKPAQWAQRAIELYRRLEADCIVAEVNQGGEMVESVLRMIDPNIPVRPVRANRSKWLRAEPVAMLYEQGRVFHAGSFPDLENEMCDFGRNGLSDGRSPDRVDALVWAIGELALKPRAEPRITVL